MNNYLDKLYCINLEQETVRYNFMTQQFNKLGMTNFEMIKACGPDHPDVTNCLNGRLYILDRIKTISQIAIAYSHYACWNKILSAKQSFGCIIEDDIRLNTNFIELYKKCLLDKKINEIFVTKPCILWLTGLKSIGLMKDPKYVNKKDFEIMNIGTQYGNCMYVINHQMAKLLIDNFYPLRMASDDYIIHICHKFRVNTYSILPILCYDLSSNYYSSFWSLEDKALKENFKRLSGIGNIKKYQSENKHIFNKRLKIIETGFLSQFYSMLMNKREILVNSDYASDIHFLVSGTAIRGNIINNKTVICGAGVERSTSRINKPLYVSLVRGPITKNVLERNGISCPDNFGDPLLLISSIYKIKRNMKTNKIGIYCEQLLKNKLASVINKINLPKRTFEFINYHGSINALINNLNEYKYILTNNLLIITLCHSYGIKAIIFRNANPTPISDHCQALCMHSGPVDIFELFSMNKDTLYKKINDYPQPTEKILAKVKSTIIRNLPFIDEVNFS